MRDAATCPACGNWWTLHHVEEITELVLTCACGEQGVRWSDQVGAARHALDVSTSLPEGPREPLPPPPAL